MQVHYIDDDEIDAQLMLRKADAHKDFELTTATTLEKDNRPNLFANLDCLLIDINRPDAESIEADVALVRGRTRAPIIFVTGGMASDFRVRAQNAGAEAVIDKDSLSVELVEQLAFNARGAHPVLAPSRANSVSYESFTQDQTPVLLVDYLDVCLWRRHRDRYETDIRRCCRALQLLSGREKHDRDAVKLSTRLHAVRCELEGLAARCNVSLALRINPDQFTAIGRSDCVEMGLICLIGGLIRSTPKGSAVSCTIHDHDGGPAISYSSSDAIGLTTEELFEKRKPHYSSALGNNLAICTGIALLGLRRDQISSLSEGSMQRIMMH